MYKTLFSSVVPKQLATHLSVLMLLGVMPLAQARLIERVSQRTPTEAITQAMRQAGASIPPTLQAARDTAEPGTYMLDDSEDDGAADRLMRNDSDDGFAPMNTRTLPERVQVLDNNTIRQRYGTVSYAPPPQVRTFGDTAAAAARAFVGDLRDFKDQAVERVQDALYASSNAALVVDAQTGREIYSKNTDRALPVASMTKLMTAMVTLDAKLDMNQPIMLDTSDFVGARYSGSALVAGETYNRAELMLLALMKSENPAAAALARTYPGGKDVFMRAMNEKARRLGMYSAYFGDPTGLDGRNVASARDVVKMAQAAYSYEVIRRFSTTAAHDFYTSSGRVLHARNTNALVRDGAWQIGLSKTGFIREAGRCVVMQAQVNQRPAFIVLMGARDTAARSGDATRILSWMRDKLNL